MKPMELILDVGGVGYLLSIPISTYEELRNRQTVSLFVYTLHKEDTFRLFGFYRESDRELFSTLLSVTGIGPSMALSILSGISHDLLIEAVTMENPSLLLGIPGIGQTKADKIIFELKRKVKKIESLSVPGSSADRGYRDTVDALVSLGFDEGKSSKIARALLKENPNMSIEETIKESLKKLSG